MPNKIKLILIVLACFALGALTAVFFRHIKSEEIETPENTPIPMPLSIPKETETVLTETVSTEDRMQVCENDLKNELTAEDAQYEKGSILVSFKSDVSLKEAEAVIKSNSLTYETRENLESDFETNRWLSVKVSEGQEIKWICVLKENDAVKNAIVNRVFDLHQ